MRAEKVWHSFAEDSEAGNFISELPINLTYLTSMMWKSNAVEMHSFEFCLSFVAILYVKPAREVRAFFLQTDVLAKITRKGRSCTCK